MASRSNYISINKELYDKETYPIEHDPNPTTKDYIKGFFTRYFLQLASDDKAPVIEVKKGDYARADTVYFKENVRWSLSKDKEEQKKFNLNNILRVEKTFPQIRMKIYNFVEFHKKG